MPSAIDTDGPEVLVDLRLPAASTSPAMARSALHAVEDRFDQETLFKIRLLISELVTNSVKHARLGVEDHIWIRVITVAGCVRAEVMDEGLGLPAPEQTSAEGGWEYQQLAPDPEWPGGWGLSIVERLADRWGVVQNDETTVWFEVAIS
jgi:anti-sigma regulatory factor (Ser/Thr protein kinase)